MVAVPSAIIFINTELVDEVRDWIVKQLHITEYMDGYTFDTRIADGYYPATVTLLKQRIMVIRPANDYTNREFADVVVFFKEGMIDIEFNRFGPPRPSFLASRIYWGQFCVF